jgi:hypothetical protein
MEITKLFFYGSKRLQRCKFIHRKTNEKLKTYDVFPVSNCKPLSLKLHQKNSLLIIPHVILLIYVRNIGTSERN